ncbi:Uncharacterized protein TCM_034602 [Theobroma cacao]|uniref:Uncharacterized protein n=1 Tax=Theobroma cacao TaxID=3641 RepID=A0A061FE31_THECC|nr:Uncharacterized protein TCM_034602 [Theobroma cacao]
MSSRSGPLDVISPAFSWMATAQSSTRLQVDTMIRNADDKRLQIFGIQVGCLTSLSIILEMCSMMKSKAKIPTPQKVFGVDLAAANLLQFGHGNSL